MDDYKAVTSALEGRLSLLSSKARKRENSDADYFQSRPEARSTVNSWLSARAISERTPVKTHSDNDHAEVSKAIGKIPRLVPRRSNNRPSSEPVHPRVNYTSSTNSDAFTLTVELAQPVLYLEGFDFQHSTAHRSAVLRGFLRLRVVEQITLRELTLEFRGISQTIWPESWRLKNLKKTCQETITSHSWNFLHDQNELGDMNLHTPRPFKPGFYTYNFELPLESWLPESIELPLGAVYYTLSATATQAGIPSKYATCAHNVTLVRIPCVCSLETVEPSGVNGVQHGLRYSFMLHAQSFPVGDQAPLGIRLVPLPDCSWQRIYISIEQDVRYRTRDGLAQREQSRNKGVLLDKRAVKHDNLAERALRRISAAGEKMSTTYAGAMTVEKPRRGSNGSQEVDDAGCLHEKVLLQLPSCSTLHPGTAYSCIYVRHWLVITVLARVGLADNNHRHFEIRIRMPIHLLTCKLTDGNTILPEYSERPKSSSSRDLPRLCRCASSSSEDRGRRHTNGLEHIQENSSPERASLKSPQSPPAYQNESNLS